MWAGKDAPDGGGKGAETTPPLQAPVVLGMALHCAGCAKKVVKAMKHLPGVKSVVADAAANRVVVEGTADAAALKAMIEARTRKRVEIISGGGPDKAAAESKAAGGGGGGGGERKEEAEEKKPPPEEKKPKEETVLLKIRLHCDDCADRIRRRIYKIKGVKDVVLEGNAKDEVKVKGTMDVTAMVVYLREKLGRTVEAVVPGMEDGEDDRKDGGGVDGDKKNDKAAEAGSDMKQKGKGVEVAGPSVASAAASMAPPPAVATTHHVSPYGYSAYPYPQPQAPSYHSYYGGNADGAAHSTAAGPAYYQHPPPDAGAYHHHHPPPDAGAYHHHHHHQGPITDHSPQPYPYQFNMAPAPQMFSDENPNACSVM